jgi:alpha-L-arabinofuranosidase
MTSQICHRAGKGFVAGIIFLALVSSATLLQAGTVAINIDVSKAGPRLNPRMYGIFLEEINHGVDGGLYAELIRNRGFEDAKPPEGFTYRDGRWLDEKGYDAGFSRFGYFTNGLPFWSLVQEGGAHGSMHLDMTGPLNPATPRSLRLEIEDAGSGRIGIANEGFWGIGVVEGEKYNLSFWARGWDGFSGPLTATLETANGEVCNQPVILEGAAPQWKQFKATLTATKSDPKARFVMTASTKGKVWFDLVSLFPAKTFKNRPNGLRADIAQMIADLKPGFVRFPGGCVVEGGTVETAYDWKKTVGPLERREEIWGAWNYRRTHGMGYHEYLQFCEDIGAAPLFVGFAGETCMFRQVEDVPMSEMGPVATNLLDAVEYANGDANTTWGKLRAEQGHREPFGLKLMEIGNENGTRLFPERYRLVHSALKAQYPDMTYIADLSFGQYMRNESFDMEDNHFYNSPQWFLSNTHHYDQRDRKLSPVYDGEVAVTSAEGGRDKGNLIAALGEGAFLMGLERNADVVRMVSYAPLLANVHGRTDWHGMIYFDSTRVFGTVSYYLWKLYGLNRPTYTVQTDVDFSAAKSPAIAGAIGVGTWDTSAEFKDIRVEKDGQALYQSDFAKDAGNWKKDGGNWSVADGAYRQNDAAVGVSYFGDPNWTDYTLTLKARKLSGTEGFLVVFGRKGEDRYWWNVGGWGNREHAIEFNRSPVGPHVPGEVETDRWYDVKVELRDRHIRCYLDGKLLHDETAASPDKFLTLAGRDESSGDIVLKAINTSAEPMTAMLNIAGTEQLAPEAEVTVIKSGQLSDNNSLENPAKVAPVTGKAAVSGPKFTHEFPAYSFTLMRLKTK